MISSRPGPLRETCSLGRPFRQRSIRPAGVAGLAKRTVPEVAASSLGTPDDLEAFLARTGS